MVPLFFSVTVPDGCRSKGCHGYPTRLAHVLMAPPSFQAHSPSAGNNSRSSDIVRPNFEIVRPILQYDRT